MQQSIVKRRQYLTEKTKKWAARTQAEADLERSKLATGLCHNSREQSRLSRALFLQNPFPQMKKKKKNIQQKFKVSVSAD